MPTITREINGSRYLYFVKYDRAKGRKRYVYCGRADSETARRKASRLETEYVAERAAYGENTKLRVAAAHRAHVIVDQLGQAVLKTIGTNALTLERSRRFGSLTADYVIIQNSGELHLVKVYVVTQVSSIRNAMGLIATQDWVEPTTIVVIFAGLLNSLEIARQVAGPQSNGKILREGIMMVIPPYNKQAVVLIDCVSSLDEVNSKHLATLSQIILAPFLTNK